MAVNEINPPSVGRRPRAAVAINGTKISADVVEEAEISNNNFYSADKFSATLVLAALPAAFGWSFWSDTASITVEIFLGFATDPGQSATLPLKSLIKGLVDEVDIDPVGGKVHISGRDFVAQFIDIKTTEKFANQTSSEIAALLAARHGFQTAITPTTTPVGRYYELEHSRLTNEITEWDLLTFLAQEEGFACFMRGDTLHFQPPPAPSANPYVLRWIPPTAQSVAQGNFTDIKFHRNLTLAKDVIVIVRSWHDQQEKAFTKTVHATNANKKQSVGGQAQTYEYTVPGLTPDQALKYGQARLAEITQHERIINAQLPGDVLLDTTIMVQVTGTGTGFDQTYFPDSIERRFSFEEGFRMSLRAKNHSPQSVTIV